MQSQDNPNADPFGLLNRTTRNKLKEIRPTVPAPEPNMDKVDAAAASVGFISRETLTEPQQPIYVPLSSSVPRRAIPSVPINMRVPSELAAIFQRFCKDNRYSYPEGLEEIMMRAGMVPRK